MTDDIAALIEKLEAAQAGSRELDLAIEKALRRCPQDGWLEDNDEVHWNEVHPFGSTVAYEPLSQPLTFYTTSLDAALTLLPDGWTVAGIRQNDDKEWNVELREGYLTSYTRVVLAPLHLRGKTPALAFCIAALKARAA